MHANIFMHIRFCDHAYTVDAEFIHILDADVFMHILDADILMHILHAVQAKSYNRI